MARARCEDELVTESVEEFLARGGKVEQVEEAPRAEKMGVPFGGVAAVTHRQFYAVTDMRRAGTLRDRSYKT